MGEATQKENMEAPGRCFSGPGLRVVRYCFHHVPSAIAWSSGRAHLREGLRDTVWV